MFFDGYAAAAPAREGDANLEMGAGPGGANLRYQHCQCDASCFGDVDEVETQICHYADGRDSHYSVNACTGRRGMRERSAATIVAQCLIR